MKFNLKNKPKVNWQSENLMLLWEDFSQIEKWFEGFEKELKELYKNEKRIYGRSSIMDAKDLIKEILGE